VQVGTGLPGGAWIAKVYHDPAKAAAVARGADQLATTAGSRTLRLAPIVAHLPELDVVVQGAVPGRPLDELLGSWRGRSAGLRAAVARAGEAVAELHEGSIVAARHRPIDRELARFVVRAERVATVDPQLGDSLCELAHRLQHGYRRLPEAPAGPVHGDCKPSQFLVDGPRMYLLDLDHCGIGDQAGDVGTFVASLRQLAARQASTEGPAGSVELEVLGEVFVSSYLRRRGDADLAARIGWYEAVALQRKALRSFARSPLSRQPAALVAEAHRCLDRWEASA
jgi:Ser/Thr protein kinase RdoA (MazF antagonist)